MLFWDCLRTSPCQAMRCSSSSERHPGASGSPGNEPDVRIPQEARTISIYRGRIRSAGRAPAAKSFISPGRDALLTPGSPLPVERPHDALLFLIKLYFAQSLIPNQVPHLIDLEIITCEKFLTHLEAQRLPEAQSSDTAFLDHVVLRSRIHQTRALLHGRKPVLQTTDVMEGWAPLRDASNS